MLRVSISLWIFLFVKGAKRIEKLISFASEVRQIRRLLLEQVHPHEDDVDGLTQAGMMVQSLNLEWETLAIFLTYPALPSQTYRIDISQKHVPHLLFAVLEVRCK